MIRGNRMMTEGWGRGGLSWDPSQYVVSTFSPALWSQWVPWCLKSSFWIQLAILWWFFYPPATRFFYVVFRMQQQTGVCSFRIFPRLGFLPMLALTEWRSEMRQHLKMLPALGPLTEKNSPHPSASTALFLLLPGLARHVQTSHMNFSWSRTQRKSCPGLLIWSALLS